MKKYLKSPQAAAKKTLSKVDADLNSSHQHEFGTTKAIRSLLGSEVAMPDFDAVLIYETANGGDEIRETRRISYYDSRRKVTHRGPELRCYFPKSAVFDKANPGDTLTVAKDIDGTIFLIVSPAN